MAHHYRADKHNKSKKEIPSYLKYDNSLLGKIKRLFKRNKYSGTIEQEERLNRKKYSKSVSTNKPKFSINFDSEFDLVALLQVVIPCVLLITIGILSACNVIIPAFEQADRWLNNLLEKSEFMFVTQIIAEFIMSLVSNNIILLVCLGLFLVAGIFIMVILEALLFVLFWILYAIFYLLFIFLGNILMIFLPLGILIFGVVMAVRAFNDGLNKIPTASCIIIDFIMVTLYYVTFFNNM